MGATKVIFSRFADRDLDGIVPYIARENPQAAVRLGLKLIDRALALAEDGCSLMGSSLTKRPHLRKLLEGKYLIVYRV